MVYTLGPSVGVPSRVLIEKRLLLACGLVRLALPAQTIDLVCRVDMLFANPSSSIL